MILSILGIVVGIGDLIYSYETGDSRLVVLGTVLLISGVITGYLSVKEK